MASINLEFLRQKLEKAAAEIEELKRRAKADNQCISDLIKEVSILRDQKEVAIDWLEKLQKSRIRYGHENQ
jgi:uncharacterized protein YigA (DUF484 family)